MPTQRSILRVPIDTSRGARFDPRAFSIAARGEAESASKLRGILENLQGYVVERNQIRLRNEAMTHVNNTKATLERQLAALKKQQMDSESFRVSAEILIKQTVDKSLEDVGRFGPTNNAFVTRQLKTLQTSASVKAGNEADSRFVDEQSAIFLTELERLEHSAVIDLPEDVPNTLGLIKSHIANASGTLITNQQGEKLRQRVFNRIRIAKLKQRAMNNPELILDALAVNAIPNITPTQELQLTRFADAQLRRMQRESERQERLETKRMKKDQEQLALTYMLRASQGEDISLALNNSTIARRLGQQQFGRVFRFNEAIKKSLSQGFKSDPHFLARAKAAAVTGIDPLTGTAVDEDFFINNAIGDNPRLSGTHLGETLSAFVKNRKSGQAEADSTFRRNFSQGMKIIRLAMGLSSEFDTISRDDEEALYLATLEYTKRAEVKRNKDPRDIAFEVAQKWRFALKETQFLGAVRILEKLGIKSKDDILDALDRGDISKDFADILISYFEFLDRAGKLPKPKTEEETVKDTEGGESSSFWDWDFFKMFQGSSKDNTRVPKKRTLH